MEKTQKERAVPGCFMQNEEKEKVQEKVLFHREEAAVLVIIHEKNRGPFGFNWNIGMRGDKKTVVIMRNLMYNQQQQVTKSRRVRAAGLS